jgi:Carboxypeptidase regulatory-like domain
MLDHIKIASPCSADWEQMEGNDRVRFCGQCKKNIFNLSAMTRKDVESLLLKSDGDICTRLYRRADGTVLTADCPVGLRLKVARVQRRLGWAISGTLSLATAWGQSSGVLSGRVTDITGVAAPPTTVTLVNSKTGTSAEAKTDADGKFKVTSLSKGI